MSVVDGFEVVRDEIASEEVWLAKTSRGLPVRVVPTERFSETAAMITFRYGSTDLGFAVDGVAHESPEGVAHYLEHKLFEDEEIKAFDRFARRGAKVNAMTGFTRTSYHFTATSQVEENLTDLLHLVSRAHITEDNVDKERGIIAQELRMYEDSPDYRLFFDYVGCLYESHPVRHPVGGTVASIEGITAEELLTCYGVFYRTGNAALAVAGPVDPQRILALAEACELGAGAAPGGLRSEELGAVQRPRVERQLQVPRTKVMMGYKDRSAGGSVEERLRRDLLTEIVLDCLFSAASEVREDLRRRGLVDDSLSSGYMIDEGFGFSTLSGETDDAEALIEALRGVLAAPLRLDDSYLDRFRRKMFGRYVRSFASVRNLTFAQAYEALDDVVPFGSLARLRSVTAAEVEARREEHFRDVAMAVAVAAPVGS